jgi:hypothetical protein
MEESIQVIMSMREINIKWREIIEVMYSNYKHGGDKHNEGKAFR